MATLLLSAHSDALHAARTSAEFAAVISALDSDLNAAIVRKAELEKAEDKAIFGDGDLAEVRKELADCNSEIGLYEKAISLADLRRIDAAKNEAAIDIEALGADAKAKSVAISAHWRKFYELTEAARAELFEADALQRTLTVANQTFDSARRPDLKINLPGVRREAMKGPRAAMPARMSRTGITADKILLSFLSSGGPLENRAGVGAPVDGISSNSDFHRPEARN
ncbi:hypothetical protein [Mesorhizobium muleiense]|uniref:hypothetical protein n=1 Tax=Mesorhizobium muleiense TaxID=1004279 RepID=UPI001F41EFB4|nr:hypothetical protein [Mesorhizobium muleiense]MCF6112385.1 hypothetical protein [Mesorhizobium muleiense]